MYRSCRRPGNTVRAIAYDLLDGDPLGRAAEVAERHAASFAQPGQGDAEWAQDGKVLTGRVILLRIYQETGFGPVGTAYPEQHASVHTDGVRWQMPFGAHHSALELRLQKSGNRMAGG